MSNNKYVLNLHFNSPNLTGLHNPNFTYKITGDKYQSASGDKYLLALYDKAFYGSYIAGPNTSNKGAYYGTFTSSCYFTDGKEFKFLIVYPEAKRGVGEEASLLLGKIVPKADEHLLLNKTSSGNKLQIYNSRTNKISDFEKDVSLDNTENRIFQQTIRKDDEPITIPDHDIKSKLNDGYYLLSKNSTTSNIELKEVDMSTTLASSSVTLVSPSVSEELTSETILVQETQLPGGRHEYYLWVGNPFTKIGKDKGKLVGNERIALSRENGEIIYEFVDDNDKQISTSKAICTAIGGCKMEDLNLIPNIRTYLKSTLVSADIADIKGTQGVSVVAVSSNVKDMLANDNNFKQDVGASVGVGATPEQVAQALVTDKPDKLGQAVLNANDSNGHKLEQQLAKDGTFQTNVTSGLVGSGSFKTEVINKLKGDSAFKQDVKGPQGDPGPAGPQGDAGDTEQIDQSKLDQFKKKDAFKIMPGKSYSENRQEAELKLVIEEKKQEEWPTIATFLKVGYFFKNDELYIHDHITGNITLIPKGFHFLKVVETGLNDYKWAFCNNLGNLFFEYKKYEKTYANLPEECKLIDLKYIKGSAKIDLGKYYLHEHAPSFAIKKGDAKGQSFENHMADVYEIEKNEKVGSLIDEFGFFEHGIFNYIHHNQERVEYRGSVDLPDIHPIVLYDGYVDMFNYCREW